MILPCRQAGAEKKALASNGALYYFLQGKKESCKRMKTSVAKVLSNIHAEREKKQQLLKMQTLPPRLFGLLVGAEEKSEN